MAQSATRPARALSGALSRMFPTPQLLLPRAVGVDISDASAKWIILTEGGNHRRVAGFGDEPLQQGIVAEGVVKDIPALAETLRTIKQKWNGIECAHAALPEEAAYVFNMHVPPGTGREQTLRMVEFELEGRVPIPPDRAVYDFDVIEHDAVGTEIGVFVFPIELAESYAEAFRAAGITLLSLEIEARSIARAVISADQDPVTMLVDFGRVRTGIAVVKRGIPIFTSTVAVGGDVITRAVEEGMSLTGDAAQSFKNEEGLYAEKNLKPTSAQPMMQAAGALTDEVGRHFHYWDTRRNEKDERTTPVERVILVGGSSNLKGLDDFIAGKVQAATIRGNVWRHVDDFDNYIPPIDRRTSIQYATAIGLALRSISL
ncbi:MAG: pilus assembly protein PilM [bacterium]|nr:pilus assembly protein PilM [bacterium]